MPRIARWAGNGLAPEVQEVMRNIFYIIGVVVVVLAILSLVGLA